MDATQEDCGRIAELHDKCFPRGWTKNEILTLIEKPEVSIIVARTVGEPKGPLGGFNIIRQTLDEAEILSIATDPARRKQGLATQLLREAITRLHGDRIKELFLEVDSTNVAAVHLYTKLGFDTVGTRPAYYNTDTNDPQAPKATALVMRLELG